MIEKIEPDQELPQLALDVWENEGGALGRGTLAPSGKGAMGGASKAPNVVRKWNAIVTFQRPFILDGFRHLQPGGAYSIHTEEERSGGSMAGTDTWRRIETTICLTHHGALEYVSVEPSALIAALHRDAAQGDSSSVSNTARTRLSTARTRNALRWR